MNNITNSNLLTKNQHMIPQVVQKEFATDENKLKIYGIKEIPIPKLDEKTNKKHICRIDYETKLYSIKKTMYKNSCYEFDKLEDENWNKPNTLERKLAEYENEYKDVLDNLKKMIKDKKSFLEIKKYIEDIAMQYFMIFYLRTYQFALYGDEEKENKQEETFLRFKDTLFDSEYRKKLAKSISNNYNLYILESLNGSFLLSDSYIATASFDYKGIGIEYPFYLNRSIGLKNIIILIPISSNYYIMYTDNQIYGKNHYIRIYDNNILFYNSIIYRNSYEFTVGKNQKIIKNILNEVPKYATFSFSGNSFDRNEVWCDIEIDKMIYLNSNNIKLKPVGYTIYCDKYGNKFVEKPIKTKEINSFGYKIICRNPNYL